MTDCIECPLYRKCNSFHDEYTGNAPNITVSKPSSRPPKPLMEGVSPKPLMEGLMQAGKVAQTLLNSMGISQQNQLSQLNRNQQKGLLGNPPMMNMNTTRAASNFMNTMQQCNGGKQDFNSLFGSNNGSSGNMNKSGILGNYQGHGMNNSICITLNQLSNSTINI